MLTLAVQQLLGYSVNVTIVNGRRPFGPSDEVCVYLHLGAYTCIKHLNSYLHLHLTNLGSILSVIRLSH